MSVAFNNKDGQKQYVHLGSYGIGITRLMGVLVEKFHDDKGIIWPELIAPYRVQLVSLGQDEDVLSQTEQLYHQLEEREISVLWDDRDASAGVKLADADLMGLPHRVVISRKTLEQSKVEYKQRSAESAQLLSISQLSSTLSAS